MASAGLYQYIKEHSGYTEVRYVHIVGLPWTLKAYRQAKGEFWLKSGMAAMQDGQWREAFEQLRMGLPHAPENEEARLTLSRLYLMVGRPDLARPLILEGLAYRTDQADYLRTVVGFLFGQQADSSVVELAESVLANDSLPSDVRRLMAVSRLYAHFNRDQFAEARAAAARDGLGQSVEAAFIEARIAWETGTQETAVVMLRALHQRAPRDPEVYRTLVLYLRSLERHDEARRVVLSRQLALPDDPDAYVDSISLAKVRGNEAAQAEAEAAFLKQFSGDPDALLKLGSWAAREGEPALAWQISSLFAPSSPSAAQAILFAVEAEVGAGAYGEAYEKIAAALASAQPWTQPQKQILKAWAAVAQLGSGESSEALLVLGQLAQGSSLTPATLTILARSATKIGNSAAADRLLRRAVELDPLNQPALVELLRLKLDLRSLDGELALANRLPEMRKPPADLMYAIAQNLESDRYLFVEGRSAVIANLEKKLKAVRFIPSS